MNKGLKYNEELMVITMEECGELIQACSKAIRNENYTDNKELVEEIGDVLFLIGLITEKGLISSDDITDRMELKQQKLKKWSNLLND